MKILLLDIEGDYKVTDTGIVYGARGKPLKQKVHYGYFKVRLRQGWVPVHRIVARAFIPNPNNLETVNHKDGNKLNNELSNLEWVSRVDNLYHAMDHNLHPWGRTKVKDSLGNIYASQAEAARSLGACQGNINRAINSGGFYYNRQWGYV